jgi:hypothetical protein
LNTSVGRAEFLRQLYNLRHVLESDKEAGDTEAKIRQFQNNICGVIVDDDGGTWEPLLDDSGRCIDVSL